MFLHGKPDPRSRSFNLVIGPPQSQTAIPNNATPISMLSESSPTSAPAPPVEYQAVKVFASNLSPGAQAIQIVPK